MDSMMKQDVLSDEDDDVDATLNPTMKPFDKKETLQFCGNEEMNSAELKTRNVTIIPSSGGHETGSSKIKMKNVVDFKWECRYYTGQLLALHLTGKYLAYSLKPVGKAGGMVRVVNRETGDRSLLKKMDGMVHDIAFAHIPNEVIVATVDEFGTLFVNRVEEEKHIPKMNYTVLLQIKTGPQPTLNLCHRVVWCPFSPMKDEDNPNPLPIEIDEGKLLCITQGTKARLLNVGLINARFGSEPLHLNQLEGHHGYLEIAQHSKQIIEAAIAPDGSAIATASQDGYVKFFQVEMSHKSEIRCLHEWQPHGNKPLTSLMFVDNFKFMQQEQDTQFWKFAITGAENNTEIKFWSCESWTCIQTIHFAPEDRRKMVIKAGLDLSGNYLLLSDIQSKLLYVLQIYKYPEPYQRVAYIRTVTEFLLPCSMLCFAIYDAGIRKFKSPSLEDLSNEDGEDDIAQYIQALVVRMFLVQPKSLQECHLAFQPPLLEDQGDVHNQLHTLSDESLMFVDALSDLAVGQSVDDDSILHDLNASLGSQPLTLLGPNAFTSPGKNSPTNHRSPQVSHLQDAAPMSRIIESSISASPPLLCGTAPLESIVMDEDDGIQPLASSDRLVRPMPEACTSGGSSPSREVQEILSLNSDHSYYDKKLTMTDVEVAAAQLHMVPNVGVDAIEVGGSMKGAGGESDGWPPIPLALVNEARHFAGENINSERKFTVYVFSVEPDVTKDQLYNVLAANKSPPNSIDLQPEEIPGSNANVAILEYSSLKDIDTLIEEFHHKPPNYWNVSVSSPFKDVSGKATRRTSNARLSKEHRRKSPATPPSYTYTGKNDLEGYVDDTIDILNRRMLMLMEVVEKQSTHIKELTVEVSGMRKATADREKANRNDKNMLSQIEKLLAKSRSETTGQVQDYITNKGEQDWKKQEDAFLRSIAQLVNTSVSNKLPGLVHDEVQTAVSPQLTKAIQKMVEPLQIKLQQDIKMQLAGIDLSLKQHIVQLVQSKAVSDILSQSAVAAMKPASQACFTEVYMQSIMPRFEQACAAMFSQINDTFTKGTQEFVQNLESQAQRQQQHQDKTHNLMNQLQTLTDTVQIGNDQLKMQITAAVAHEISAQLTKGLSLMQDSLTKCMRENVKEQLTKSFQRHQAAIQAKVLEAVRCITPAPHMVDTQTQILQLIAQEDINGAFQTALSASDLGLVVLVCEKVDPEVFFSQQPCPLQQNVLLSLIQQLSADMTTHTDTKQRYLLEAVMNLDPQNVDTRTHIPGVILRLQQQLTLFIANSTNAKMSSKVRQLLFSTRSFVNT